MSLPARRSAERRTKTRTWLRRLHLWMGLTLGALFVLLGLTGSALVFYVEIDAALNPQAAHEASLADPIPSSWDAPLWDVVLNTAREKRPDPHGKWSFEVTGQGGAIPARYYPADHGGGHHAEREMHWFSADGTRIIRSDIWGGYVMSWIYELHMHLLAGETGRQIVGWSGVAILLLLLSGLIIWWPRGSWRKALTFKRNAVPIRRLRDWHKLSGLWSLPLLFLLSLTGAFMALPDVQNMVLTALTSASKPVPQPVPQPAPYVMPHTEMAEHRGHDARTFAPLSAALRSAQQALPDARLAFIDVPNDGIQAIRIRAQVVGDPHHRFPSSFIFVDPQTGRVLAVHDALSDNPSSLLSRWIRPLHDGSIGGLTGRIIAVILGLVPLALFLTGLCHWRRRIAARAHLDSLDRSL